MEATIGISNLFPSGWPKSRLAGESRIGKRLHPPYVKGYPHSSPGIFLNQGRESLNQGRLYRNASTDSLPDGAYLFLIEYEVHTNKYFKQFVRVNSLLELGSRHFQLPTQKGDRVVLAAGELIKNEGKIIWNLRSGTFMKNFIKQGGNSNTKFRNIVENAFRNSGTNREFLNENLLPNIPTKLKNLIKSIKNGKTRAKYLSSNNNSNNNEIRNKLGPLPYFEKLHQKRVNNGNSSPNVTPNKKPANNSSPSPIKKKQRINGALFPTVNQ